VFGCQQTLHISRQFDVVMVTCSNIIDESYSVNNETTPSTTRKTSNTNLVTSIPHKHRESVCVCVCVTLLAMLIYVFILIAL